MTNQEIINYVMKSPNNTNPAILNQMIDQRINDISFNEKMDIVVTINTLPHLVHEYDVSKAIISEGSMEAVREAFGSGRIPKGKVIFTQGSGKTEYGIYGEVAEVPVSFFLYGGYIHMRCLATDPHPSADQNVYLITLHFDESGDITQISLYKSELFQWVE